MRICLIATELKGFGPYGGFGVLTHDLALGLTARGLEVYVAMPRKNGQRPVEKLDGMTVVSYPSGLYTGLADVTQFAALYRAIDADVYHSQEPSLGTALAELGAPGGKHVVTFQDPRNIEDWRCQWWPNLPSRWGERRFMAQYQRESGRAARRADARYCQAKSIIGKAKILYRLKDAPGFLPNPVKVSSSPGGKETRPTVCFLGRWDAIKRPELFLDLAGKFPDVCFVMSGGCLIDPARGEGIERRCAELRNVTVPGWLSAAERDALLDRAWIVANTSTKECLPVSYLEAGAHKCAILSHCNADDFASNFGYWAKRGDLADFVEGLTFLLQDYRWRELGEKNYEYVKQTHEFEGVIDRHLDVYRQVLGPRA